MNALSNAANSNSHNFIHWSKPDGRFIPKEKISEKRACELSPKIKKKLTPLQYFNQTFPQSLYIYIAQCTNERIRIHQRSNKSSKRIRLKETDKGEIQLVLGCILVMSYNRVPSISNYWSQNHSLGNEAIKDAISRDRFKFITSKMYFADPEKPENSSKTYYIDHIVECLKGSFRKCRKDSCFQSIDESMTKFKGRSSLKQYMPLKPVRRGIKMWLRCDSNTGYTYDFNIYTGKETQQVDGTLGERVVRTLASTIKENNVTLCFDRFFTSVHLLQSLNFPAVGTCIPNRKNLPKITNKLKRGESVFQCTSDGLMFVKWQDTKEVLMLSNCHKNNVVTVNKKMKDGSRSDVPCPEMVAFYREHMGGVDLADQMASLYDFNRKSTKWWRKVFFRLVMMAAVNAWILSKEINNKKFPFLDFLVSLAEEMISEGRKIVTVQKSSKKISKRRKSFGNVSMHLPVEGDTRRRCKRCAERKTQTRTKTICQECDVPLCKNCFAQFHS
jgi:hypothetical protein